ncbi:hypothetical protein WMY93_028135 [Mugilogobius chulae]|uniref:Alkylated DNA repair protein AlkB homologue 8 N-terminal domain-containing protein n=1 Tax=Mugilogobius chulae TaxID=88201 RepID=A0AAW0MRZ1_9GOBI
MARLRPDAVGIALSKCVLCLILLGLLTARLSALITYDRSTLLHIESSQMSVIKESTPACSWWPSEIRRDVSSCRFKRRRGKRGGVRNRLRAEALRPPLPSILLANVQSLDNKLDDLRARVRFQRDIRDCNIFCFTETWLTPSIPDHAVLPNDMFTIIRMDRTLDSGKSKGGGVCFMINNRWCNPANIKVLSDSCSPYLEHLAILCRPFYLPREITSVITIAVYIPPQADTDTALVALQDIISKHRNKYPDAALIVAGDFNKANLKRVLPNFYQHVTCPTRGVNILDHCYSTFKNGYKSMSLPAFGSSDHVSVFLIPKYSQKLKSRLPQTKQVRRWTDQSEGVLQDALDDVDWAMFQSSADDIHEFTDVVISFVYKLTEDVVPTKTIKVFSNQKPWVDRSVRGALNARTAAYNQGDMSLYKAERYNVRKTVNMAKQRYGNRVELQLADRDSRRMWQGLRTITDYKGPAHTPTTADQNLVEDLNKFFTRFEVNSASVVSRGEPVLEDAVSSVSEQDVRRMLLRVNGRKAPGPDFIPGTLCNLPIGQIEAEMMPSPTFYIPLSHIWIRAGGGYVRLLFIDYSSAFNTIVPQRLTQKLGELGLSSTLCLWDCTATKTSNAIVKFADDTVVIGLISNNNEAAYFEEVALLSTWCKENNLVINVSKTKEIVVDPRRGKGRMHQTQLNINGSTVERVPTYKYLGVNIAEDMKWDQHISSVVKKSRQRLYHLRKLRQFNISVELRRTFYCSTHFISGLNLPWAVAAEAPLSLTVHAVSVKHKNNIFHKIDLISSTDLNAYTEETHLTPSEILSIDSNCHQDLTTDLGSSSSKQLKVDESTKLKGEKIGRTTTDNGSNFIKALRTDSSDDNRNTNADCHAEVTENEEDEEDEEAEEVEADEDSSEYRLSPVELSFLNEYVTVMTPVAKALNILQAEAEVHI